MVSTLHELNAALSAIFNDLTAERDAAAQRALERILSLAREAEEVGLPLVVDEYVDTLRRMVGLPVSNKDDDSEEPIGDLDSELGQLALDEEFSEESEESSEEEAEADEWSDDFGEEAA